MMHKFLAFPVVDEQGRIVGVVDVSFFTEEVFDIVAGQEEVFEAIGFHVAQVREASPLRAFRFRFPWLLATIGSGTVCALLAAAFELTLAKSLVLAFFLTLVLGLAESVSVQSMTIPSRPCARYSRRGSGICGHFGARRAGAPAGRGMRDGGGGNRLVVAGKRGGRFEHRHEPAAGALHGVLVRPEHPGGIARAKA